MKRILLLFLLAVPCFAQITGNITASGSTCATTNACVSQQLSAAAASAGVTISGTWSATLQFEASNDNGATWAAVQGTPIGGGSATTSATTNDTWRINVSGMTNVRVRGSAYTSGTAQVTITFGSGSASSGGSGTGGSTGFDAITPGTNTAAAMVCGTGCSIDVSGSGSNNASMLGTHAASYFQVALGYTPLNPANNLTDVANPATALSSLSGQTKLGATPTTVSMGGANGTKALVYVNTTPPLNLSKTYFDGTDWQIAPSSIATNTQALGSAYAIKGMDNAAPDLGKLLITTKATAGSVTLAQAGVGSPQAFPSGFFLWGKNLGAGTATVTATTSKFLINDTTGSSTQALLTNGWCQFGDNGTNYISMCSPGLDSAGQIPAVTIPNTAVTPGSYTTANITVGADGRVTAASNGTSASTTTVINNTPVTCDAAGACGTSETALQTVTVTANTLTASNVMNFTGRGLVTASGGPNLTLRIYGGASGTVLLGTIAWSSSVQTNAGWFFNIDISCGAPGASVACEVQGHAGDPANTAPQTFPIMLPNTATINLPTNGSQTFRVTAQWSGTTSGNTTTSRLLIGRIQ